MPNDGIKLVHRRVSNSGIAEYISGKSSGPVREGWRHTSVRWNGDILQFKLIWAGTRLGMEDTAPPTKSYMEDCDDPKEVVHRNVGQ